MSRMWREFLQKKETIEKSVAGYYTTAHGAVKAGLFGCMLISPGEISSLLI